MYHNILVPLDGSKRAEAVLGHIEGMAMRNQARVILLKVEDPPIMLGRDEVVDIPAYRKEREECRGQDESYLADLQKKFEKKGVEARCQIACGPVVSTILDTAESEKADLIAMSTHSISRFYQEAGNSVAAGLLQKADRPLLLIRENGAN
jgi:nucleotide-binding universal stress UspA family protein